MEIVEVLINLCFVFKVLNIQPLQIPRSTGLTSVCNLTAFSDNAI